VNNSLLGCTMEKMVNNDDFREIVVVNWDCRLDWLGCMMVKLGCTVGFEKNIRSGSRPLCILNNFYLPVGSPVYCIVDCRQHTKDWPDYTMEWLGCIDSETMDCTKVKPESSEAK
jgi:hypothetical protein